MAPFPSLPSAVTCPRHSGRAASSVPHRTFCLWPLGCRCSSRASLLNGHLCWVCRPGVRDWTGHRDKRRQWPKKHQQVVLRSRDLVSHPKHALQRWRALALPSSQLRSLCLYLPASWQPTDRPSLASCARVQTTKRSLSPWLHHSLRPLRRLFFSNALPVPIVRLSSSCAVSKRTQAGRQASLGQRAVALWPGAGCSVCSSKQEKW